MHRTTPGRADGDSETGRVRFRRVRFQTPNSVSVLSLTELRGENSVSSSRPIYYLCAKANSPSFWQKNSPSSLSRNSSLEKVVRPFPIHGSGSTFPTVPVCCSGSVSGPSCLVYSISDTTRLATPSLCCSKQYSTRFLEICSGWFLKFIVGALSNNSNLGRTLCCRDARWTMSMSACDKFTEHKIWKPFGALACCCQPAFYFR